MLSDFNIYLVLVVNGFISGLAGAAGAWAYNAFIKRHAEKLHEKIKGDAKNG